MIDLIIAPVSEWLVKKGMRKIQDSSKFQHSRQAIREAIYREIRFNRSLITEVLKDSDSIELARCIAEEMEFSAFSKIEESFIPIKLFFDGDRPFDSKNYHQRNENDRLFLQWSANLDTESRWVERIYLRARILRARWRTNQLQKDISVRYVEWLMINGLKSSKN